MSKNSLSRMAREISRRSGICVPTVEVVLQAAFDEWRWQLTEGSGMVLVESFGTLTVKDVPARSYHYSRPEKGIDRIVPLPEKRVLKFKPTRNLSREVERRQFDPTRQSFYRHPDDPQIRYRSSAKYKKKTKPVCKVGQIKYEKPAQRLDDSRFNT